MRWITGIKIFFLVLFLALAYYVYGLFTETKAAEAKHDNVPDLSAAYNADEEIAASMKKLENKKLEPATVVTHNVDGKKQIALTFDGLPRKATVDRLLDVLEKHSAPATFFAEGGNAALNPKTLESIENKGQAVGNYTFVGLSKLDRQPQNEIVKQLCMTQKVFEVTSNFVPKLFKAPQTRFDIPLLQTGAACGLKSAVKTDVFVPIDAIIDDKSAAKFMESIPPGSIVSLVVSRPIDVFRYKESKINERPAVDKKPDLRLSEKNKVKHADIVEVTDRLLVACKQKDIKVVPLTSMRTVRLAEPQTDTVQKVLERISMLWHDSLRGSAVAYAAENYEQLRQKNAGNLAEERKMLLTTEPAIAFCFVGWSRPEATENVLERLKQMKAKGTFFVGAKDIQQNEALVRRVFNEGHELAIAVYAMKNGSFASVCYDIEQTKLLLRKKFGVETDLVKQPWGAIEDYTREAVSAMGCQLISQNVNMVQTRHKNYTSANDILPELFGKFTYSLGRGWIVNFRMDFYTDAKLCADVMQLLKEKKIDNIAYWAFNDDPGNNPKNDSAYAIKSVGSILNNKKHIYTIPVTGVAEKIRPEYNSVENMTLREYISKRYIGTDTVNIDINTLGFEQEILRYLDYSGIVHTNRPVVFFSFDDWGTDAPINQLLYVLRKHNVKCSFFVLTRNVKNNPNLLRAIAEEGHEIACHTFNHKPMAVVGSHEHLYSVQSPEEQVEDYRLAYEELVKITGDVVVDGKPSLTRYFRPPTLTISKSGFEALKKAGYEYIISGSTSTHDYMADNLYEMIDNIREGLYDDKKMVKNGAVFVMHMSDSSKYTARALDILLTLNEQKPLHDPTRFEVGRLSDYLIDGYDQSNKEATLKLQQLRGQ